MAMNSEGDALLPPDGSAEQYACVIGARAHRVAALVLAEGVLADRGQRVQQVIRMAREVLAGDLDFRRPRAALMDTTTAAASYLHRFALPAGWEFVGDEVPLGGGRADLVYYHPSDEQWLVDEIKTGRGRVLETALRPQINRYLVGGSDRWGDAFAGVRLCAVAHPTASRFFRPGRMRSMLLAESPLAGTVG